MPVDNTIAKYHVYGPALIQVGTGTTKALQALGFSQDGVEITLEPKFRPIYSDVGGADVPVDHQYMGTIARIRATLVDWKEETIRKLRAFPKAALSGTDGTEISAGLVVGQNTSTAANHFYLPLAIPINDANNEDPWYFPTTIPEEPQQFKLGTNQWVTRVGFLAFAYVAPGATTRNALVTYSRTIS